QEGELRIGAFPPRLLVALVEAARALERQAAHEAVRGDEFGPLEARHPSLIVDRYIGHGDDRASDRRIGARLERRETCPQPARAGNRVVVGEGNEGRLRRAPAKVASAGRPLREAHRNVSDPGAARAFANRIYDPRGPGTRAVVGDDDLEVAWIEILRAQRKEAPPKELRPAEGRHHHTDARRVHLAAFSSRKDPITRASSGEVQKHSTASRGVQTMGSPRVLKEVFTRMGTPVLCSKAASRSWYRGCASRSTVCTRAVPSTWHTAGMRPACSSMTSNTKSMKGAAYPEGRAQRNQSAARSRSTAGATGRKSSRSLISFSLACM